MDYGCVTPFVDTTCTNIEDLMVGNAIFSKDRVKLESSIRPPVVSLFFNLAIRECMADR